MRIIDEHQSPDARANQQRVHDALADGKWHSLAEIRRHLPHLTNREVGNILAGGAQKRPPLWQRANLGDRSMYAALPPEPPRHRQRRHPKWPPMNLRILPEEIHRRAQQVAPRHLSDRTRDKWERMQVADPHFTPPLSLDTPPPPTPPPPLRLPPPIPRTATARQGGRRARAARRARHYRKQADRNRRTRTGDSDERSGDGPERPDVA